MAARRSRQIWISARAIMVAMGGLPLLVPLLEQQPCCRGLGESLRRLYSLQCHQRLSRGLLLFEVPSPVCARCLGIYVGLLASALVARPRFRLDAFKAWILVATLLMLLDVATESVGLRPANAALRVVSGVVLAYPIGLCISEAVRPRRDGYRSPA